MLGPWLEKEKGTGVTGCFLRHGRKLVFLGLWVSCQGVPTSKSPQSVPVDTSLKIRLGFASPHTSLQEQGSQALQQCSEKRC